MAPMEIFRSAKWRDPRRGVGGISFLNADKKCFADAKWTPFINVTLPAMAAVSASGMVAGARLSQDTLLCARRRAPEAPKVRFGAPNLPTRRVGAETMRVSQPTSVAQKSRRCRYGPRATRVFERVRLTSNAIHSISSVTSKRRASPSTRAGASRPSRFALSPPIPLGVINDLPENGAPRVRALVQRAQSHERALDGGVAAEHLVARHPPARPRRAGRARGEGGGGAGGVRARAARAVRRERAPEADGGARR